MKQKYHQKISKALADLAIEKISFLGLSEVFHYFIGKGGLKLLEEKGFDLTVFEQELKAAESAVRAMVG